MDGRDLTVMLSQLGHLELLELNSHAVSGMSPGSVDGDAAFGAIMSMKDLRELHIDGSDFDPHNSELLPVTGLSRLESLELSMRPQEAMCRLFDAVRQAQSLSHKQTLRRILVSFMISESSIPILPRWQSLMSVVGSQLLSLGLQISASDQIIWNPGEFKTNVVLSNPNADTIEVAMAQVYSTLALDLCSSLTYFELHFHVSRNDLLRPSWSPCPITTVAHFFNSANEGGAPHFCILRD